MNKPQFRNYCECRKCVFLGRYERLSRWYDLYFCPGSDNVPGLYIRWGNDAVEVEGIPAKAKNIPGYVHEEDHHAFYQAVQLAKEKGLMSMTISTRLMACK